MMDSKDLQYQKQIYNEIKKHNTIITQRHQDPDPDAIGSQLGLAEAIKTTFPNKHVFSVGSYDKGLAWMGTEDNVSDDTFKSALVIVTDCANSPRISDSRFSSGQEIIKIDHHPNVESYGNINWINSNKSSASEMIVDLCQNTNLRLNKRSASLLYAGIIGDTGRFMFPGVTSHTFVDVATLAKFGINMNEINRKETETTLNITHLYGYLDEHLKVLASGAAYYGVTQKLLHEHDATENDFISKNVPGNIKGIIAWLMYTEMPDGSYKISFRSHGPAIDKLAAKYNGGGHPLASGARAKNKYELHSALLDLNELVNKYNESKK